jgi:hypothetical protein
MARFSAFIVARGFHFPPRSTVTAKLSSRHYQVLYHFAIAVCRSKAAESAA